jgi:polyisoprenoid-binding protein YceI
MKLREVEEVMMRNRLLGAAIAAVALAVLAGAGVWYFVLRSDAPDRVTVESAVQAVRNSTPVSGTSSNDGVTSLAGTWKLVQGANSFVGYRVGENLAGIGATQAVGRTTALDGTLSFDGKSITATQINADLTRLKSDKNQRDNALKTQARETSKFPSASFVLSSPISIDMVLVDGQTVSQTIAGKLTLHGVSRDVSLQVQGVMANDQLVVVGSAQITFADYSMTPPRAAAVLAVDDHGTMELQLVFARA